VGAWALLLSTVSAFLPQRCWIPILAAAGKVLLVVVFPGTGYFWAAAFAQWRLADALPHEWERRDIQLVGVVVELP
jgi:competence protein ComEC